MKKLFFIFAVILLCSGVAYAQEPDTTTQVIVKYVPENHHYTYQELTHGDYDKLDYQILVGYVNKSYICEYASVGTQRENFWGEKDRFFHGYQVGCLFTPSFDWGLGLRTGGAVEVYMSYRPWMVDKCAYFYEMDLYIPLQASYRIPFTPDCALTLYGGAAFQWAMGGRYVTKTNTGFSIWRGFYIYDTGPQQQYGVDGFPKSVNWQAECGLEFRIKHVMLSFTYSWGLNDHEISNSFDGGKTIEVANKSRQDKMQATISFVL